MYQETHRTTGDGYSIAVYRADDGTFAVQETTGAFIPSPTVRLELGLPSYALAMATREAWVTERQREAVMRRRERAFAQGFAIVGG